jgi:hypothetical protein
MKKMTLHARILEFPYAVSLSGGRLVALQEVTRAGQRDLLMDYQELKPTAPIELVEQDGKPFERVRGNYIPRRLRCAKLRWIKCVGLYNHLETVPLDHGARSLRGVMYWRPPGEEAYFRFFHGSDEPATLMLSAQQFILEDRPGPVEPVETLRGWSVPPALPARLIPIPGQVHARHGGDPITIHLGSRQYHQRLFVGGIDSQGYERPAVGAVLNLGEEASLWVNGDQVDPPDRWSSKGEGQRGMELSEIIREANWVIERLRQGQRVLVHCAAGLNRSVTVCCAVLILLEGLSAEAALKQVSEHHPWARPDSHHWLMLRWLAKQKQEGKTT